MEFSLDEGQVELQQTVARFCADRFPLDELHRQEGRATDRRLWAEMAALGIFGLLMPADGGGNGLGVVEGALAFEQLGSHLMPGPLLWTALAAPFVDGAAGGDVRVGGVAAEEIHDGSAVVEHAAEVDVVLVARERSIVAHLTKDLDGPEMLDAFDPLTPVGRFNGLGDGHGTVVGGPDRASELRLLGTVLSAAMLAGVASQALDVARAYALERRQFDAPIGSFQAIKHLLADMYVRSNLAQSATYAAAAVAQQPGGDDPVRAAGTAKLLAADAAIENASTAIQVLGGMGFTWDILPNYLLKRAWVLDNCFGTADDHAQRLGSHLVAAAR